MIHIYFKKIQGLIQTFELAIKGQISAVNLSENFFQQ